MAILENKGVFIVSTGVHLPRLYPSKDILSTLYSDSLCDDYVSTLAKRLALTQKIQSRGLSIELDQFPHKRISTENQPLKWGEALSQKMIPESLRSSIDFFSLSYNVSAHEHTDSSLAHQIATQSQLSLKAPPQEFVDYGCAAGMFSLAYAFQHCKGSGASAWMMALEQASWMFDPIYEKTHPNFKRALRSHALFGDGAGGILLTSGEHAEHCPKKYKILDIILDFESGETTGVKNGHFLVDNAVKSKMPALVSKKVIRPLLTRHGLTPADITQWSIHQGGLAMLAAFEDKAILGLSPEQTRRSKQMFLQYGNMSSPSNLVVLDSFFHDTAPQIGQFGMLVGFGTGYYMGAMLYQCVE